MDPAGVDLGIYCFNRVSMYSLQRYYNQFLEDDGEEDGEDAEGDKVLEELNEKLQK